MAKQKHILRKYSKKSKRLLNRCLRFFGSKHYAEQHSKVITKMYEQEDDSMGRMIESTKRLVVMKDR